MGRRPPSRQRDNPIPRPIPARLHPPLAPGNITGPATDLHRHAKEMLRDQARLSRIISSHTGKPLKQIEEDCDRNYWLDAKQSMEYGVVDKVLQKML